jgi:superfamily I DNA/RNA helicase
VTSVAEPILQAGHSVLAATPYRAQVQLLRRRAGEEELDLEKYCISTIHRQQGAEYDVVLIDTVAAGRPFQPSDLCAMLNVAASRARRHLIVFASRSEAEAVIPGTFLSLFPKMRVAPGPPPRLEPLDLEIGRGPEPRLPDTLGDEIHNLMAVGPIYTDEQVKLFERHFGVGHYLVRGVAGSGKTFVLANWVARLLREEPQSHVLVSYYNKALCPLVERLVKQALEERLGASHVIDYFQRIRIHHVDHLQAIGLNGHFDAVFVDEAQDMGPVKLNYLYHLARPVEDRDGRVRRRFFIFMDDSQNVYGQKTIEEFRHLLDNEIDFTGRTRVLKEAFRSPREILDLAFNVVLDPKELHEELHGVAQPGMKEFLRENELVQAHLLRRPEEGRDGLYRVDYTEREGMVPMVVGAPDVEGEGRALVGIVQDLQHECVRLSDILVVSPCRPDQWATVLRRSGIRADAFGGARGADPSGFPIDKIDIVRVTTIFSCKGHESPVVLLCGTEDLDNLEAWMDDRQVADTRLVERRKRCLFYVGATRAMVRQYVLGLDTSRFLRVAKEYAALMSADSDIPCLTAHAEIHPAEQPIDPAAAIAEGYMASKKKPVFHKAGCKVAAAIPERNRVHYATKDEAIQAGKTPCQECNP